MDRKKKIVFVNQASGYLTIDIINAFVGSYDHVALISGIVREQNVPLDSRVKWSKIALYNRGNPRTKLLSWLKATFQIFFLLVFKFRSYEIFYITIPPTAYLLSLFLPNKFSILVYDVYPDVLQTYKIKSASFFTRVWGSANRILFRKAHRIYTISVGMAQLLKQYTNRNIIVIPNWSGLENIHPVGKDQNPWISQQGLTGKFIVQYSGNIGFTHNVELVLEVARKLKGEKDIVFLIIGRGEKLNKLLGMIESFELTNCKILPFQPDNIINYSLAAADIGVVLIEEKTGNFSLPSKIYNMQAVGVPLLCIASSNSAIFSHIQKYQNGQCFVESELDKIASFVVEMKNNEMARKRLAENSRNASADFTSGNALLYFQYYQ
jgi:glycosyltransferase involved in cell wall biosynthesis